MPTYEFACRDCERSIEVTLSFDDPAPSECPTCGGSLRRVYSPVGVVFKGSGFYKTDSRLPRREPKSDGSKTSPDSGSKTDGSSSESSSKVSTSTGGSSASD